MPACIIEDLSPVGLLVEDGRTLSPVATGDGAGNFFLKPNGIFMIGRDGTRGNHGNQRLSGGKA